MICFREDTCEYCFVMHHLHFGYDFLPFLLYRQFEYFWYILFIESSFRQTAGVVFFSEELMRGVGGWGGGSHCKKTFFRCFFDIDKLRMNFHLEDGGRGVIAFFRG